MENFTKRALRDFLKARYNGDLGALNKAWNTDNFYTSWDHGGGWGTGRGFLDEDGSHPWVCASKGCGLQDAVYLSSQRPAFKADLDAFLKILMDRYSAILVNAARAVDPNHLIATADSVNGWGFPTYPPVLASLRDSGWDLLNVGYSMDWMNKHPARTTSIQVTYDQVGKPMIAWTGLLANADSSMRNYAHPYPPGVAEVEHVATQQARGERYRDYILEYLKAQGTNGDYPMVGLNWWGWMDQTNELANWGLVTYNDNAYDGVKARELPPITGGYPEGWSGTSFPSACEAGDLFFRTDQPEGANLYICNTANQWGSAQSYARAETIAYPVVAGATNGDSARVDLTFAEAPFSPSQWVHVFDVIGLWRANTTARVEALAGQQIILPGNLRFAYGTYISGTGRAVGLPATCAVGSRLFQIYDTNRWNLFFCAAENAWAAFPREVEGPQYGNSVRPMIWFTRPSRSLGSHSLPKRASTFLESR